MSVKEEGLKVAGYLKETAKLGWADDFGEVLGQCSDTVHKLVEENDELRHLLDVALFDKAKSK